MDERPKVRAVDIIPIQFDGRPHLLLRDPLQLNDQMLIVSPAAGLLISLMDGTRTLREIQVDLMRLTGELVFSDQIEALIQQLDNALLLDNDRFRQALTAAVAAYRQRPYRLPALAGRSYPATGDDLRAMLDSFFDAPKGPGHPQGQRYERPLRGLVVPHIDLQRGGFTYAWAYKDLAEAPPADLFVILGIAHHPTEHLFTATTKDFLTPLGLAQTERSFLDLLQQHCPFDLFADEFAHCHEHSVELQVIWLQHLFGEVRIVPLLCAGFEHLLDLGEKPTDLSPVRDFLAALERTLAQWEEPVTLIASVDLSHVGARFGDRSPLSAGTLRWLEVEDRAFLERVAEGDADGAFQLIHADRNRRRVDAYPAVYVLLKVLQGPKGIIRHYDQSVEGANESVVTFGAVVFP